MPGYTYEDYGLTPMEMEALGLDSMTQDPGGLSERAANQDQILGWDQEPATKPGFDWPTFLSLLLKSGGAGAKRSIAGADMAPRLAAGPVAHTQGGGRRRVKPPEVSQYQPMKLGDFSLRGLSSLIPRNPLVSR